MKSRMQYPATALSRGFFNEILCRIGLAAMLGALGACAEGVPPLGLVDDSAAAGGQSGSGVSGMGSGGVSGGGVSGMGSGGTGGSSGVSGMASGGTSGAGGDSGSSGSGGSSGSSGAGGQSGGASTMSCVVSACPEPPPPFPFAPAPAACCKDNGQCGAVDFLGGCS